MKRRKARELALQVLYQLDLRKEKPTAAILKNFWKQNECDEEVRLFAEELIRGTYKHLARINSQIQACAENWNVDRMATVDRNVLRLGAYEILYRRDIPATVTINEAVEIAKKFGTDESGPFVNGILDSLAKLSGKLDTRENGRERRKGTA